MSKKMLLFLFILNMLIMPTFARAETSLFSISGKIRFYKSGDLFVRVVNRAEFNEGKGSVCEAQIAIGEEQIKRKEINFTFDNIPQGIYGIICYQDVNNKKKGKPDTNFMGLPKEPGECLLTSCIKNIENQA